MGTSGAFGGSTTQGWRGVAEAINQDQHGDETTDGTEDESSPPAEQSPVTGAELAALIAQALQKDDPGLKPRFAPTSATGDSGLSLGKLLGNPRLTGTTKGRTASSRREIVASTGRAGRAIGAGYALAGDNVNGLASYGLDLRTLQGTSKFDQIFAIMDAVNVGNSGPDDIALRATLVEALDSILDGSDDTAVPEATLRDLVAGYAVQLFAIEIDALVQAGNLELIHRDRYLAQLSDVIRIDSAQLDVSGAQLTTPAQFEHAAQQLMRGTLVIVARGGGQ